jgi:hypothetical protein
MAQIFYQPKSRILSNDGSQVGSGYKFYFYQTGTTTPITTYSNVALSTPNSNPVVADSNGYIGTVYVADFSVVKVIVKDANDNIIYTVDPVNPSGSGSITLNDLGVRPTSYWGVTAGTSSVYTMVANPTISAYANTQTLFFQPHVACAAAPTINIDGVGAINLKKYTGQGTKIALQAGDLQATERYIAINDGTDLMVINPRNTNFYTGTAPTLTIATGAVTITNGGASYTIDTEGSAATDDLDTISGGATGEIIIIGTANSSRDIVLKSGTGNIVNASGIDVTLASTNDRAILLYNGTNWLILAINGVGLTPIQLIQSQTASASASIAFTTGINSTFSKYIFEFINIVPASNSKGFQCQVSVDGGANYVGANYLGMVWAGSNSVALASYTAATGQINFCGNYNADVNWGAINSAAKGICGSATLYNPSSSAANKTIDFNVNYTVQDSTFAKSEGASSCNNSTTAINAIKFFFDSGNIASGTIKMYGVV